MQHVSVFDCVRQENAECILARLKQLPRVIRSRRCTRSTGQMALGAVDVVDGHVETCEAQVVEESTMTTEELNLRRQSLHGFGNPSRQMSCNVVLSQPFDPQSLEVTMVPTEARLCQLSPPHIVDVLVAALEVQRQLDQKRIVACG